MKYLATLICLAALYLTSGTNGQNLSPAIQRLIENKIKEGVKEIKENLQWQSFHAAASAACAAATHYVRIGGKGQLNGMVAPHQTGLTCKQQCASGKVGTWFKTCVAQIRVSGKATREMDGKAVGNFLKQSCSVKQAHPYDEAKVSADTFRPFHYCCCTNGQSNSVKDIVTGVGANAL